MALLKYRKSMCDDIVKMMSQGDSIEECCSTFGCSSITLYRWANDPRKPEFKDALNLGRTLSEAWWMRLGRKGMLGEIKGWSAVSWIFTMKCRFHWKETQVLETLDSVKMVSPAELDKRVAEFKTVLLAEHASETHRVIEHNPEPVVQQHEEVANGH